MENQNQQNQPAVEVPENLTPQQALAILVQGVQFAQTKGVYSLTDAELISKAVRVFTNQDAEGKEGTAVADAATEPSDEAPRENVETTAPVMEVVQESNDSAPAE